jgi:hypothetical protein
MVNTHQIHIAVYYLVIIVFVETWLTAIILRFGWVQQMVMMLCALFEVEGWVDVERVHKWGNREWIRQRSGGYKMAMSGVETKRPWLLLATSPKNVLRAPFWYLNHPFFVTGKIFIITYKYLAINDRESTTYQVTPFPLPLADSNAIFALQTAAYDS